jgi:hypothetical protein
MPETQTDPYAEFQDAKPASQRTNSASVSSSDDPYAEFQEPKSKVAEPTGEHDPNARFFAGTKPAEISAVKTGLGPWLEGAENDLRYGGESTWLGKAAHTIGLNGIRRGVSEQTGDLLGGAIEAPIHAAQTAHELVAGHPIKAVNKAAQTLGDVALPATVVAPELLPLMAPRIGGAIVGSRVAGAVAPHITSDPDRQELISNIGVAVGAGSPEILEHSTAPIVRGGAKTYNVVRGAAEKVAPVAGVGEGLIRLAHGDPHGAIISALGGDVLSRTLKRLPEAPESLTRYGLKPIDLGEPTAESSPLKPIGSKVTEPASELKPIGTKSAEAPEEPVAVRQSRHVVGDEVTEKLKNVEGGADALQRLTKATHQQWADLANVEGVRKPKALAAQSGEGWTAADMKRSTRLHGKELNPAKEIIARHMTNNYSPAEILQRTEHWK